MDANSNRLYLRRVQRRRNLRELPCSYDISQDAGRWTDNKGWRAGAAAMLRSARMHLSLHGRLRLALRGGRTRAPIPVFAKELL